MRVANSQRGMSAIGWLLVLGLAGFFAVILLKLVPIYVDGYKVSASLESLRNESQASGPGDLRRALLKRLDINMVSSVRPEDIYVEPRSGAMFVNVAYEVRTPLFGNLDLVVSFDESVEVPARP